MPSNALLEVLEESRSLGFLGPGPVEPHLEHAAGFAEVVEDPPRRALDLGSGGGVPGLLLATLWERSEWVLLDANERRTAFLEDATRRLGIAGRVVVRRARAEEAGRAAALRGTCDLLTARSFGPPAVTAECAAPFLVVGGTLVVSEPPGAADRWPAPPLAVLGMTPGRRVVAGATYQAIDQVAPCPERFPRRTGVPAKRPLF